MYKLFNFKIFQMVQDRKGHNLRVSRFLEYLDGQQLYIELKDKFRKRNNYTLNIRYTTKLGRESRGFYISSYMSKDGDRRYSLMFSFFSIY